MSFRRGQHRTSRADGADASRLREDKGSTSLTVVLLTPLFIVLMFAAVQAALWGHARTSARVAARDAAAQVARFDIEAGAAEASALANLTNGNLDNIDVNIEPRGDLIVVTITGDAPGIFIGTSRRVSVTEAVPVEEITP